jgi:hypothetical protein
MRLIICLAIAVVACSKGDRASPEETEEAQREKRQQAYKRSQEIARKQAEELQARTAWQIEAPEESLPAVRSALEIFGRRCPGAGDHPKWLKHIAWRKAKLEPTSGPPIPEYMYEHRGWPQSLEVQIRSVKGTEFFGDYQDDNVFWFWIGSGARPGVRIAPKAGALKICGLPPTGGGDDFFRDVDELAGVLGDAPKGWKPPR